MAKRNPTAALEDVAVLHPALLALCPLLGLYAYNVGRVPMGALVRPAVFMVVIAELLLVLFWVLLRNRHKAGVAASIMVVGSIWGWTLMEMVAGYMAPLARGADPWVGYAILGAMGVMLLGALRAICKPERKRLLRWAAIFACCGLIMALLIELIFSRVYGRVISCFIAAYIAAIILLMTRATRLDRDYAPLTRTGNWFSFILIALYVALIAINSPRAETPAPPPLQGAAQPTATSVTAQPPDIYLIALDGYCRSDVLRRLYTYNNAPFLNSMASLGLTEAEMSTANYPWSVLSMAACLNMDYLDDLVPDHENQPNGLATVVNLYHDSRFSQFLKARGYQQVAFSPGTQVTEPRANVDVCLRPPRTLSELELVLMDNTLGARVMQAVFYLKHGAPGPWRTASRRACIEYAFSHLGELAGEDCPSPRFVLAHLGLPEPPYFFDRDGTWPSQDRSTTPAAMYANQLHYTNKMLEQTAAAIIKNSPRPPVIIIVSTHGSSMQFNPADIAKSDVLERYGNLTLTYFPDAPADAEFARRYESASLVNVLRMTLNRVFDARLPMLEDRNLFCPEDRPFDAQPVSLRSPTY